MHTHVHCYRVHVMAFSVVPSRSGVVRTFQQRTLLEVSTQLLWLVMRVALLFHANVSLICTSLTQPLGSSGVCRQGRCSQLVRLHLLRQQVLHLPQCM